MKQRIIVTEMIARVGMKVVIDEDSPFKYQQLDYPHGTIMQITGDGWCRVQFSNKHINNYRIGLPLSIGYPHGKIIDGKVYDLLTYEEFKNTLSGLIIKT